MKYKNWLNEWLALYVKPTTKIRTFKKYKRQIELHILPALGEFELNDLTATVLQRFTVDLSEKGLSANTVNGIISVLKSSLRRAVLLGVSGKLIKGQVDTVGLISNEKEVKATVQGDGTFSADIDGVYEKLEYKFYFGNNTVANLTESVEKNNLIAPTPVQNETIRIEIVDLERQETEDYPLVNKGEALPCSASHNFKINEYIEKRQDELKNYILKYYALTILQSEIIKTFDEVYKLLTANSYTAKTYMEKCDAVRGSHRTYPDTLEDAKNKAASRSSYSYPRSYSSSSSDCCGGCYVATCVYGSYDCPQVWTLRRFRDDTLGSTWYGRAFIKLYYAISPTLVKWFGKTKWFKKMWKGTLDRMVKKLNDKGVEDTPYKDKNWK